MQLFPVRLSEVRRTTGGSVPKQTLSFGFLLLHYLSSRLAHGVSAVRSFVFPPLRRRRRRLTSAAQAQRRLSPLISLKRAASIVFDGLAAQREVTVCRFS